MYVQAADFLDDQTSLKRLCRQACHQLFNRFLEDGSEVVDFKLAWVRVLRQVSDSAYLPWQCLSDCEASLTRVHAV